MEDWRSMMWGAVLGDPDYPTLTEQQSHRLNLVLALLDDVSQELLLSLFRDNIHPKTSAQKYNITPDKAKRIIAKALRELRHPWVRKYVTTGTGFENMAINKRGR